jgi:hypothetical protein
LIIGKRVNGGVGEAGAAEITGETASQKIFDEMPVP